MYGTNDDEKQKKHWTRAQSKKKKKKKKKSKINNSTNPKKFTFAFLNSFQSYKLILIDNISVTMTLFFIFEISRKLKNYEAI